MTIDKSWITLRDRNDPVFIKGIQNFIEFAKNHLDTDGKTFCPCKKCVNSNRHILSLISAHIRDHGFLPSYKTWIYHGEGYPDSSVVNALSASKTRTPVTNHEMFDAIEDVMAEQNTHEENIEEDEDRTRVDPEFDALFAEVSTEIYPGCSWMSSLNFIAKLMQIKVINKWTNTSFDQLLEFLSVALPKENHVPASYYEAKKKLTKIGLGYQSIHACKHDCALFWKENESKENCPVCNESRWVDPNTNGKKVPHKVLRYFPLTSRLRRIYGSRFTAKDMIWHNTGRSTDGMMRHPVDGKEWQEFDKRHRSEVNAANRKKQLYPSRGGSKSFASRRHEDMQASGTMRILESWREMHYHPKNGWVNKRAEQDWKKIERERTRMQEEAGDAPVDEEECLTRVLGERRGWTRGIGRKVRKIGVDVSCIFNSPSQDEYNDLKDTVRQLTESVLHLTAEVKKYEKSRVVVTSPK